MNGRRSPRSPSLEERPLEAAQQCRCGSRMERSDIAFRLKGTSQRMADLFQEQEFCSMQCVRAFFLESLSTLDALEAQGVEDLVSDLRDTYAALAREFSTIVDDWYGRWSGKGSTPTRGV